MPAPAARTSTPRPGPVDDARRAAVRVGDGAHERKAEARPGAAPARAVERLEDRLLVPGRHAAALVGDLEPPARPARRPRAAPPRDEPRRGSAAFCSRFSSAWRIAPGRRRRCTLGRRQRRPPGARRAAARRWSRRSSRNGASAVGLAAHEARARRRARAASMSSTMREMRSSSACSAAVRPARWRAIDRRQHRRPARAAPPRRRA